MQILKTANCAKALLTAAAILFAGVDPQQAQSETDPKFYAVGASASVQAAPPQIVLEWERDPNATSYTVYRKEPAEASWGQGTVLPADTTRFTDVGVLTGRAYEYQVSKTTGPGYVGYGYVSAGIDAPLVEDRGKVLLLVDSLFVTDLANELTCLQKDLVGDGWTVVRHDVSRTDSPSNIKSVIRAAYQADPTRLRAVFLFGHVPVPYSGNLNPDGHPDHQGAWPTDAYYGDTDGSWTDNSVSNTSAHRQANWNVPGDGKFDQSELPSDVELQVGRVDLANMTCFSNKDPARYEKDLLRQYLDKNHNFRHGSMAILRRGLICDNFGEKSGEAFAASGWRNFSAFFGAANVTSVPGWNYFSTLASQSYLWSYGCGGGSYYTCNGVGSSDDFARTDVKTVFTLFLGSYFGDWDNESNFLRAALGSTSSTLAVAWAGRPHWFLHPMGLGETIGHAARLSQNNRKGGLYSAQNYATRGVHVALLGDPTLRMHPVLPPSGLTGVVTSAGMGLTWTPSPDAKVQGYHVYRSSVANGPFARLTGSAPIRATQFVDAGATSATQTYMVRAIKQERSGSGTYANPSQGIFFGPETSTSWGGAGAGTSPALPSAPSGLTASAASSSEVNLSWTDTARNEAGFRIERKGGNSASYTAIASLGANAVAFRDTKLHAGTQYQYRVVSFNGAGQSAYSNEASAMTFNAPSIPASAVFLGVDRTTGGSWNGQYGAEGFDVLGGQASYPEYARVALRGAGDWTWAWATDDPRGLEVDSGASARTAGAWFSDSTFTVDLDLADGQTHRVAFYCVDWDTAARRQTIQILEAGTGAILNTQSLSDFRGGQYLVWNLAGHVVIRVTRNQGMNAVVGGLFFDPPSSGPGTAAQPVMTPNGGQFTEPTQVTMETSTAGAIIRYTLDGSEPTAASAEYQGPITLTLSATVKAKAFKSGLAESLTTSAAFRLNSISAARAQALFVRTDTATHGNWKGVYGADGCRIVGDPSAGSLAPAYATAQTAGLDTYVWTESSQDIRALQRSAAELRVAGCWYSKDTFSVDLDFTDGRTHRLALYFLDWDRMGRAQLVELLDAQTGALVTSQPVSDFVDGKFLVWDIKGHVQVRITRTAGNNAVLMGMFFSPAAIQLGNVNSGFLEAQAAGMASGGLSLRIKGQVGERFAIQGSDDLVNWKTLEEITLRGTSANFNDPDTPNHPRRFYRALPATAR
ncbi:MAG: chitobiase/beta-hexosaminidase C-terminal domain-containing protein [Verrucomicrobiia bacterium]